MGESEQDRLSSGAVNADDDRFTLGQSPTRTAADILADDAQGQGSKEFFNSETAHQKKTCAQCGNRDEVNASFCTQCGDRYAATSPSTPEDQDQNTPYEKLPDSLAVIGTTFELRTKRLKKVLATGGELWQAILKVADSHVNHWVFNESLTDEDTPDIAEKLKDNLVKLLTNESTNSVLREFSDLASKKEAVAWEIVETFFSPEWQPPARQSFLKNLGKAFASGVGKKLSGLLTAVRDVWHKNDGAGPAVRFDHNDSQNKPSLQQRPTTKSPQPATETVTSDVPSSPPEQNKDYSAMTLSELDDELEQALLQGEARQAQQIRDEIREKQSKREQELEDESTKTREQQEHEERLDKVDIDYIQTVVGELIGSGAAKENKQVQELILALARLTIETKGENNLTPEWEKDIKKLLQRANLHPNALHKAEKPFSHESEQVAEAAIAASTQTAGKKELLKKILKTTSMVVAGAVSSFALGTIGMGPESRMVMSGSALGGDGPLGSTIRGVLVESKESKSQFVQWVASGLSTIADGFHDKKTALFALFGGMFGEAAIEMTVELSRYADQHSLPTQNSVVTTVSSPQETPITPQPAGALPTMAEGTNPLAEASRTAVDNLLRQFKSVQTTVSSTPPESASQIAASVTETAKQLQQTLLQNPNQAHEVLQQASEYLTPERVQAIAEVASKFDPSVAPPTLTQEQTAQLATNSQAAVRQIADFVDQVSHSTAEQRAAWAPWINRVTSVLSNFSVSPPVR